MVQKKIPPHFDICHHHRFAGDTCSALLVQGRSHSVQPAYYTLDCHPTFYSDESHFRDDLMTYGAARMLNLSYEDAAPAAMIGASNHFEVAIATASGSVSGVTNPSFSAIPSLSAKAALRSLSLKLPSHRDLQDLILFC